MANCHVTAGSVYYTFLNYNFGKTVKSISLSRRSSKNAYFQLLKPIGLLTDIPTKWATKVQVTADVLKMGIFKVF